MLTLLALLSTIGSGSSAARVPVLGVSGPDRPPVRLWMNNDRRFRDGDRVRLQVDADVDGYLLVLNYDTDGRVRVLFPLDPRDDATVHAGRRYEVRSATGSESFRAGGDGTGLIYTAVSPEPWRFDQVVLGDRWDYTRLEIDPSSSNPESDLTNLVQSIAGAQGFDSDVLGYRVYGDHDYSYSGTDYPGPYYGRNYDLYCNNWSWRYDGCRRYPFDGGWAFGSSSYFGYSPYRYSNGYGYPYGGFGYPYGGYFPGRYNSGSRGPLIVGRPRSYTVVPRPRAGGNFSGGSVGGIGRSNPSGFARTDPIFRGGARGGDRESAPPARRARPDDGSGYGGHARGADRGEDRGGDRGGNRGGDRGRDYTPPAPRAEPHHSSPPPAHTGPRSGGNGGGHTRPRKP